MGHVAEQGELQGFAHVGGRVEHVIEPVAQQGRTNTGGHAQRQALGQVAREGGQDRRGAHARIGDQAPGHGALGQFEAEALLGGPQPREVGQGHFQLLLQFVVLLDQGRLALEAAVELGFLGAGLLAAVGIGGQGRIDGFQLVAAQQRQQGLAPGLQAPQHRRAVAVAAAGVGHLILELAELLEQALAGGGEREATAAAA